MAIKVGGTNVITDARALNNITSIDTTTKNAIGNAGVGGPSIASWTDLSNTYSFNMTFGFPSGPDTGIMDISTILSGLPSSWKYLAIIQKATMTSPSGSSYYGSPGGYHYFRLGSSSSSYTEIIDASNEMSLGTFYSSNYYSPYNLANTRYGFLVYANNQTATEPTSIFQSSFFGNPTIATAPSKTYASNRQATNYTDATAENFNDMLLPSMGGLTTSTAGWNTEQIGSGIGPIEYTGSYSNISYLGYRLNGQGYSSQDGSAPSVSFTMKAAYVA